MRKVEKDPLRSVGYVAEVFGLGDETIRIWCREGKFGDGAMKVGDEWRIKQSALAAVVNEMYGSQR